MGFVLRKNFGLLLVTSFALMVGTAAGFPLVPRVIGTDCSAKGVSPVQDQIRPCAQSAVRIKLQSLDVLALTPTSTVAPLLFYDDFENGNLLAWSLTNNLIPQHEEVHSGAFAIRATNNGLIPTYAVKALNHTQYDLYYSLWFNVISKDISTSAYLQHFRTTRNNSILGVFISSTGRLGYRNDITGLSNTFGPTVTYKIWHQLETHIQINGTASQVEIWLDGQKIDSLSQIESLSNVGVGRIQLGDNKSSDVYDIAFDDVEINNQFIKINEPQATQTPVNTQTMQPPATNTPIPATSTGTPEIFFTPTPKSNSNSFILPSAIQQSFVFPFMAGVLIFLILMAFFWRPKR
jgi:hypothetical protein